MTKLMTTLTITVIASILVVGGFVASPEAYSTYGGWYEDDDDDDCGHYGYYGHDDDDDDDCGNNEPRDPCDCEKPDTLKFKFTTPDSETSNEFKIEIYKKLNYIGNEDKKLTSIADVTHMGDYQIESSSFGKDKLNSNTVFAVYKTVENADDVLVSSIEIHTSCSQDLYIGQTKSDGGYSLEITDGLKNGETSISASNPQTCGDEPEPEKTGTIVIKNALTNDNGGEAAFEDFSYKVTNEIGEEIDLVQDTLDPSIHVAEVPKGAYILSQIIASTTGSYTEVLITGDKKCPTTTNESFKIKKDKTVSCTIYNDDNFVAGGNEGAAPTVKITVQVNNLEGVMADQFEYTIGAETMIQDGDIITIPINTPTMFNQTNFIDRNDPNNLELPSSIEGDGNCPDVIGTNGDEIGFLTLSANQNIECVIVYGKAIEPGVVFHFDSLRFDIDTVFGPSNDPPGSDDFDKCDNTESNKPCILENPSTEQFNVIPNITESQLRVTALIQFNVIALAVDNTMVDLDGEASCEFQSIGRSPAGNPAFIFTCDELNSEAGQFRVNYALIETLQAGKSLT